MENSNNFLALFNDFSNSIRFMFLGNFIISTHKKKKMMRKKKTKKQRKTANNEIADF
jgi:hypothetical protein